MAFSDAFFGEGSGNILIDNIDCSGNEQTLLHCTSAPIGEHNCGSEEDAGVRCPAREFFAYLVKN